MAVVVFFILHFDSDDIKDNKVIPSPNENGDDTYVSMYENFDQPIAQDATNQITYDENKDDYDEISLAAEFGTSTELTYDEDITHIYEQLYEETLPDDIIDENTNIKNEKMKSMSTVPTNKPAYFGKYPVIAIVIDDMGINHRRTAEISSLNYPLTSSFLTYGTHIEDQVNVSKAAGHEIMLHAPMEAMSTTENAPDVLTTAMSLQEIKDNLSIMLQKVKDIKGINNHMGSKLTQDKERMLAIMEVLKKQNLFFLDSRTSANSVADKAAKEMQVKYATRHVFLDNNNDKNYILGQLKQTENLALKNGYAIAIGHPKSQTFATLQEWLPTLNQKNIKLVHLSEIINNLNK